MQIGLAALEWSLQHRGYTTIKKKNVVKCNTSINIVSQTKFKRITFIMATWKISFLLEIADNASCSLENAITGRTTYIVNLRKASMSWQNKYKQQKHFIIPMSLSVSHIRLGLGGRMYIILPLLVITLTKRLFPIKPL